MEVLPRFYGDCLFNIEQSRGLLRTSAAGLGQRRNSGNKGKLRPEETTGSVGSTAPFSNLCIFIGIVVCIFILSIFRKLSKGRERRRKASSHTPECRLRSFGYSKRFQNLFHVRTYFGV